MNVRSVAPFNLRRYFTVASFAMVLIGVLIFSMQRTAAAKALHISQAEGRAVVSATRLSFLIHREFVEEQQRSGTRVDLSDAPQYARVHALVQHAIAGQPITRVNIFDATGTVVYSTDPAAVGRVATAHSHVLEALAGAIFSELEIDSYVADFISGPVPDAVLETYIPLSQLADTPGDFWEGMAVFETYQDGTPIVMAIRESTRSAMLQSWGIGLGLFGVLYVIVRKADTILQTQYRALQRWNTELETRVLGRTAELQRSGEEMQRLFNGITDGIAVLSEDRRIERINDRLHALGRASTDGPPAGSHCYEVYAHRDSPCVGCPADQTLRSHTPASARVTWECEGEPRHFEITTFPFTPGERAEQRVIEYVRDVTDRQRAEQQLIHAERLASIGVLAAGVAHEINNPLGSVAHCVTGLRRRVVEDGNLTDPDVRDYFEIVAREIRRCKEITRQLLDFAHQSPGRRSVVSLSGLVTEAYQLLRFRFERLGVGWRAEFPEDGPFVVTDAAKLHQVIFNLLHNALDACAESGGTVTCRLHQAGEDVTLEVRDEGVGMTPETLQQVFEPFFTTKPAQAGTGLGLSLAYGLVQGMGGRLEAASDGPATGARFTVRLPLSPPPDLETHDAPVTH